MDPKQTEELEKAYDEQVGSANEKLKATHEKKEYTFSVTEKRRLVEQYLIGQFSARAMNDIVNNTTLPRIGIPINEKTFTLYDAQLGKLTVFVPRETKEEILEPKAEDITPPTN